MGMAKDLAGLSECRAVFDRAAHVLGYDLAAICFEGPIEKLTVSAHAQPGIFAASMACYAVLKSKLPGLSFVATAGLSSGEWTALHVAGVVSFDNTLKILAARGQFMQEACVQSPGSMLTIIGADPESLSRICSQTGVEMANLNSREQTVLSGRREAVDTAEKLAKELGLRKVIRLNVAGAFHSSLMKPAAERFAAALEAIPFEVPTLPVVSNVTGRPHGRPDEIKKLMVAQICRSVRWYEGIDWMMGEGIHTYLECGPGKVLTGLVRRIDNGAVLHNITDLPTVEAVAGHPAYAGGTSGT